MSEQQKYRYPGVKPFTTDEAHLFFGRDKDIQDLYDLILLEKAVVLFGKSGFGKSSLINAGIIPRLKKDDEDNYEPIVIRFQSYTTDVPTPKIRVVSQFGADNQDDNAEIFIQNLWEDKAFNKSLWYELKKRKAQADKKWVLIFDQFEEFFTYPPALQTEFREELAELLYTDIPKSVRDIWDTLSKSEKAFIASPLSIKAIFAIREDRLSWLNSMKQELPAILHKRCELKGLTEMQAREAIVKPALLPATFGFTTNPFTYNTAALTSIIEKLKPEKEVENLISTNSVGRIEAFLLQICCESIEKKILDKQKAVNNEGVMVGIQDLPNFEKIYDDYYNNKISELPKDQQAKIRLMIENECISFNETTGTVVRLNTDGRKLMTQYALDETILKQLTDSFLLRAEPNTTGGFSYEISHDKLVTPVLKAKEIRIAAEKEQVLLAERRKKKQAYLLAIAGFTVALIAIIASIYAIQARNQALKVAQANQLVAQALQKSNTDATEAFNLVSAALKLFPDDKAALQARHDIDAANEYYYRDFKCDSVTNAVFSKNNTQFLAISGNKTLLFDTSGQIIQAFQQADKVSAAFFSTDEKQIITASTEGIIRFWNTTTGAQIFSFKALDEGITTALLSPNGQYIVAGGQGGTIGLLSITGKIFKTWQAHEEDITALDFSPTSDTLLTASMDGKAALWHTQQGKVLKTFDHKTRVLSAVFSSKDKTILTGDREGKARIWQVNGQLKMVWAAHTRRINTVRFLPDYQQILTCSDDRQIKLWNKEGEILKTYRGHQDFVYSVTFDKEGRGFISTSADSTIKLWQIESKIHQQVHLKVKNIESIAFSADGQFLLTGIDNGIQTVANLMNDSKKSEAEFWATLEQKPQPQPILLWTKAGQLLHTFLGHKDVITAIAFLPDRKTFISGSKDNTAIWWDTSGNIKTQFKGHRGSINALAIAPNQQYCATASTDSSVIIWTFDGQVKHILPHTEGVSALCFSPDGQYLLTGCYDDTLRVWALQPSPRIDYRISGKEGRIESVAWSPDGQYFAMGESGANARLSIFDKQGKFVFEHIIAAENKTGGRAITAIYFSLDSHFLTVNTEGGTVKVFNLQGIEIRTFNNILRTQFDLSRFGNGF